MKPIFYVLILCLVAGCQAGYNTNYTQYDINNTNVYHNANMGFHITKPADWRFAHIDYKNQLQIDRKDADFSVYYDNYHNNKDEALHLQMIISKQPYLQHKAREYDNKRLNIPTPANPMFIVCGYCLDIPIKLEALEQLLPGIAQHFQQMTYDNSSLVHLSKPQKTTISGHEGFYIKGLFKNPDFTLHVWVMVKNHQMFQFVGVSTKDTEDEIQTIFQSITISHNRLTK